MSIEMVRKALLWSAVINYGILLVWFLFFVLAHDRMYLLHSQCRLLRRPPHRSSSMRTEGRSACTVHAFVGSCCSRLLLHTTQPLRYVQDVSIVPVVPNVPPLAPFITGAGPFQTFHSFAGFNNMGNFDVSAILETSKRALVTGLVAEANAMIKHESGNDRSEKQTGKRRWGRCLDWAVLSDE
jgi:hypothetical protein